MKEIQLTKGFVTIVDDEDYEWLNQWKWHASKRNDKFYASRRLGKHGKFIHMHRLLLGLSEDDKTMPDHVDRDTLNNQRNNLRVATRSQNNANKKQIGKSGFMGVFPSGKNTFFARIRKDKKNIYLGNFSTKELAAVAYNIAAIIHHGEFANLNQV